ncbi:MAG: type II toxin-antitoxin system mRNA interferase toxin, RelE/StbE family [Bdellovibrionaceae bacterium]|nr:type II toxin-antitoxin system mRNA interferase toxin, RelE/StbE family [Pseudobdellovibrionaceae bacterium]
MKKLRLLKPTVLVTICHSIKVTVEFLGPSGLKVIRGFNDEALRDNWKGFRSSRLNKQWRVIYKVENKKFEVYVVEIIPHKY